MRRGFSDRIQANPPGRHRELSTARVFAAERLLDVDFHAEVTGGGSGLRGNQHTTVLVVAVAHAAYMLLAVSPKAVWDASKAYGRELILCTEAFLTPPKPARKTAARKTASKTTAAAQPAP